MALSDIEIIAEIEARRLIFAPSVHERNRIGSSSVDLLLHDELIILPANRVPGINVDPSDDDLDVMDLLRRFGETISLSAISPHEMEPNRLIIGKTLEFVTLPRHLVARIEGKSSLARLGLSVHVTAPPVQAGFTGRLYLEMNNIGPFPIQLRPGMKIAQLVLEHVGLPALEGYGGQFQRQQ